MYNLPILDIKKHPKDGTGASAENQFEEELEEKEKACEACGGALSAEKVNLEEFEDGKLYLMENVMAYVCQECGEAWIPEPVIEEFEKMMATAKSHSAKQHPSASTSPVKKKPTVKKSRS